MNVRMTLSSKKDAGCCIFQSIREVGGIVEDGDERERERERETGRKVAKRGLGVAGNHPWVVVCG